MNDDAVLAALDAMLAGFAGVQQEPRVPRVPEIPLPSGRDLYPSHIEEKNFENPHTSGSGRPNHATQGVQAEQTRDSRAVYLMFLHKSGISGTHGTLAAPLFSNSAIFADLRRAMQSHLDHGERVPRDLCAGCRRPISGGEALHLADGNRAISIPITAV
jgi:hypothetical protein